MLLHVRQSTNIRAARHTSREIRRKTTNNSVTHVTIGKRASQHHRPAPDNDTLNPADPRKHQPQRHPIAPWPHVTAARSVTTMIGRTHVNRSQSTLILLPYLRLVPHDVQLP